MNGTSIAAAIVLGAGLFGQPARSQQSAAAKQPGEAIPGVLAEAQTISRPQASRECLQLPAPPANDRLEGPHGDSLISTRCEVVSFQAVEGWRPEAWSMARYRWTSTFTAEDQTRGPAARDLVTEEEVVLFDAQDAGKLRPVWHARFESGFGRWRSITPELARTAEGIKLISVMYCLNGTGGCNQEFLQRGSNGRWSELSQAWLDQLPQGFLGRIRHGFRIDPQTLKGDAAFYGDADPNCCPSQTLKLELAVKGDSLVLKTQRVVPQP